MSIVKFEIFNKIAEVKSFTKAAQELNVTQPAISHAITDLEEKFGFPLVNRGRVGASLTEEGKILLDSIRGVLHYYDLVHQEAAAIKGVTKGAITVGVFKSVSANWLPYIIKRMEEEYPSIDIQLKEGNYIEIEEWLKDGRIDCGFTNMVESKNFDVTILKRDKLLCIVSEESPFYDDTAISIKNLTDKPFIMPAYGGDHDVKRILQAYSVKPNIRFELMDEHAMMVMVSHHLGISILPELVLKPLLPGLKAIPFKEDFHRTISIATKLKPSPATKAFVRIVEQYVANLND